MSNSKELAEALKRRINSSKLSGIYNNLLKVSGGSGIDQEKYPQVALNTLGRIIKSEQNLKPNRRDYLNAMIAFARLPPSIFNKLIDQDLPVVYPFNLIYAGDMADFTKRADQEKYQGTSSAATAHLAFVGFCALVKPVSDTNMSYINRRVAALRASEVGGGVLQDDLIDAFTNVPELDALVSYIIAMGQKSQMVLCLLERGAIGVAGTQHAAGRLGEKEGGIASDMANIPDVASQMAIQPVDEFKALFKKPLSPLERGYYAQWNMITSGYGMNSIESMVNFCLNSRSIIMLHASCTEEVRNFITTYRTYEHKYRSMFKYMKCLDLPGCEELQIGRYPTLYKAAIYWFKKTLPEGQASLYKMTSLRTPLSDKAIRIMANLAIGGEVQIELKQLQMITTSVGMSFKSKDIERVTRKVRKSLGISMKALKYVAAQPDVEDGAELEQPSNDEGEKSATDQDSNDDDSTNDDSDNTNDNESSDTTSEQAAKKKRKKQQKKKKSKKSKKD